MECNLPEEGGAKRGWLVDESVGVIYDPQEPDALAAALQKAAGIRREDLRRGIERKLVALNWRDIAVKTVEAYRH